MSGRSIAKWGLFLVVLSVSAMLALAFTRGEDWLWSTLRPDHAALLAGAELPSGVSPAGVRDDVAFLLRALPERLPRYGETVDSAAVAADAAALLERLPELDREGRALALMRLLSLPGRSTGTGHTQLPALQQPLDWQFYPFATYLFEDGLWIVLGSGPAEDLVGWEIIEIGGHPTEDALEMARPYVSADNASGRDDELVELLSFAGFLDGLGLVEPDGRLELKVRSRTGERRDVQLRPVALASPGGFAWGRRAQEAVDRWSPADPRPRSRPFSLAHRPEDGLLYARIDAVANAEEETLAEFGRRVAETADREAPERVVIDLRSNGGGNNQLVDGFVDAIAGHPAVDRPGRLYTLIGRRTYSAAGALTTAMERRTRTLFVGEPSGFTPNHHGDAVTLRLPGTDLLARLSTRYWQDGGPYDRRVAVRPHVTVPLESRHHFDDEDPAITAVLEHRPEPREPVGLSPTASRAISRDLTGRYRFSPGMALVIESAPAAAAGSGPPGGQGLALSLEIHRVGPWASSTLYPLDPEGTRLGTDIDGVHLLRDPESGRLEVDWRGERHRLPRMEPEERLPIQRVRDGLDDPAALDAGIAAFRRLHRAGAVFDSRTELALNRFGYDLLRDERVGDALALFELQAELFPTVPNVHDSLGEAVLAAGDTARAVAAFRRALTLDPGFDHPRSMLRELGRDG